MPFGSAVPEAIQGLLGIQPDIVQAGAEPPSWKGRLKEAAYTSPKGTRVKFTYENVSRESTKRTAAFEFPGVNDAYVQDNGFGARRYPIRAIFWGDNHDLIATAFEAALLEPGMGKLEHPLYGTFNVVPFGDITRRDDLKDAANQTVVEVTFWTTTGAVYPTAGISFRSEVLAKLDGFDVASANQFSNATNLRSATAKFNMIASIRDKLDKASKFLSSIAAVNTAVIREFRDAQSLINEGLDVLVGQPLQLALQVSNMIKAPARALAGIRSRLDAYDRLAQSIFESSPGSNDSASLGRVKLRLSNDFQAEDLTAMNAIAGSVLSTVEHTFATKPEALAAAEALIDQLADVVAWRDGRYAGLGQVDEGGSYQALLLAVQQAVAYLIQTSSALIPERRIVLDRPRTIIDLAAELYGEVDARLDFLIATNELSGDEILEMQRGRVIKYYL